MDRDDKTALEDQISENLKRAFGQRGPEELPDRFRDLLEQLRTQDDAAGAEKGSDHGER